MSVSSVEPDRIPAKKDATVKTPSGRVPATVLPLEHSLLESILALTTDHIFLSDPDGRVLTASRAGSDALGLAPTQIVGKTSEEIGLPPALVAHFDKQREKVIK